MLGLGLSPTQVGIVAFTPPRLGGERWIRQGVWDDTALLSVPAPLALLWCSHREPGADCERNQPADNLAQCQAWSDCMMRVTIACPEAMIADANQLALCLGMGPDDVRTYGEPIWQDAAGNRYVVASALVGEGFVGAAISSLAEPPWGADMAAAARAQAAIQIDVEAAPDRLAAVFGDDAAAALALLGLSRAGVDE